MCDVEEICKQIHDLEDIYLRCKHIFPAIGSDMIGQTVFKTASYYQWQGYNITINTGTPIDQNFIDRYMQIGNWINENTIIRLFGVMNYHDILDSIDQSLPAWRDVDLMRRMRNVFTKTRLNYEPNDPDNIRLRGDVIDYYNLNENEYSEGEIPTPVDSVIQPMFERCKEYVRAKLGGT